MLVGASSLPPFLGSIETALSSTLLNDPSLEYSNMNERELPVGEPANEEFDLLPKRTYYSMAIVCADPGKNESAGRVGEES